MKMKNRSNRYDINRPGLDMDTDIVNIKIASVWLYLYVLSNTWATFEAQFTKNLSNIRPELLKALLTKNGNLALHPDILSSAILLILFWLYSFKGTDPPISDHVSY